MRLFRAGNYSLQRSLRNLVIPRQPVGIIDWNLEELKFSPYILTFSSPSFRKDLRKQYSQRLPSVITQITIL